MHPSCRLGLAALLLASAAASAAEPQALQQLPASVAVQNGVNVSVALVDNALVATLPSGKTQNLGELPDVGQRDGAAPLLQADFNFDGNGDVAVFDSSGYMGVNLYYTLYLWDAASGELRKGDEPVSNPQLLDNPASLISAWREGPRWFTDVWFSAAGKLYKAQQQVTINEALLAVTLFDKAGKPSGHKLVGSDASGVPVTEDTPDAVVDIKADKVWLYERPDAAAKTKMYVVKGDKLSLLDYAEDAQGQIAWFLAHYEGRKPIEKWVTADSLGLY